MNTTTLIIHHPRSGTFKESVDVGRSLAANRRSTSKTAVKPGYGDQGDQAPRAAKKSPTKKAAGKKQEAKKAGKKAEKK